MITLLTVALAFGVQSAIDWTWFFTGVATAVLICAGWLAGRGPLSTPVGRAPVRRPIMRRRSRWLYPRPGRSRATVRWCTASRGISRLLWGSKAEEVVRDCPCPVLVVKAPPPKVPAADPGATATASV